MRVYEMTRAEYNLLYFQVRGDFTYAFGMSEKAINRGVKFNEEIYHLLWTGRKAEDFIEDYDNGIGIHQRIIIQAMKAGKAIPEKVLLEYK